MNAFALVCFVIFFCSDSDENGEVFQSEMSSVCCITIMLPSPVPSKFLLLSK